MNPDINPQTPPPIPEIPPAPSVAGQPANDQQNTAETPKVRNPDSSQNSLLIAEMREGMLIMNDGSFRAVIACESINFDLMSGREREGIEYSYQGFLNSLYYPVQIYIRSEKVDIGPYLEKLVALRQSQDNMLLGVLMEDYIMFINNLSMEKNIMDKHFYVVVPYFATGDLNQLVAASKNIFTSLSKPKEQQRIKIDRETYVKAKDELSNRVNATLSGLFQMGIKARPLSTNELSALYYNTYNPDTAIREPLTQPDNMIGTYVQKGIGEAPPVQGDY